MDRKEALEIYKVRSEKFRNTQLIQWRMNISIWTLLVLAIFYKSNVGFVHCNWHCISLTCSSEIAIAIFVIIIHWCYCNMTQKSLNYDKALNTDILEQLNNEVTSIAIDYKIKPRSSFWWVILQTSLTVILAVIFISK